MFKAFDAPSVALSLSTLFVAYGVVRVTRWGYWLFMIHSVLFSTFLISHWEFMATPLSIFGWLAVPVLVAMSVALLGKEIRAPYFNPRLRWWERARRQKVHISAEFQIDGVLFEGEILDMSVSGCFATVDAYLEPGLILFMRVKHFDQDLKLLAKVVRIDRNSKGVGLCFPDAGSFEKREIRDLLESLSSNPANFAA